MDQVLVVAVSQDEMEAAVRRLLRGGFRRIDDAGLPNEVGAVGDGSAMVCIEVLTGADAQRALLRAASGYSVVVRIDEAAPVGLELLDGLGRVGPVQRVGESTPGSPALSETQIHLLTLLRDGSTLTDAAAALSLSRRTANRRLTEARAVFGTTTHRQTVMAFAHRRPGLPPSP